MLDADDDGIIQEIIGSIGVAKTWCHYSPDFPSESAELSFDWDFFSKLLKHKVRYVFFQNPKKYKNEYRPVIPSSILEKIGDFVVGLKLFYNTETDGGLFNKLEIFRACQHTRKDRVESCKSIGPLSPSQSKNSYRFSPAGIPMFYGSRKEEVAIEEVIDRKRKTEIISTGCFENVKPLNLVDLTKVPEISIFDLDRSKFYEAAIFLKVFAKNISKEIVRDGREHFEYVPTQVVTEYIRHVVSIKSGFPIDGLVYKSAVSS